MLREATQAGGVPVACTPVAIGVHADDIEACPVHLFPHSGRIGHLTAEDGPDGVNGLAEEPVEGRLRIDPGGLTSDQASRVGEQGQPIAVRRAGQDAGHEHRKFTADDDDDCVPVTAQFLGDLRRLRDTRQGCRGVGVGDHRREPDLEAPSRRDLARGREAADLPAGDPDGTGSQTPCDVVDVALDLRVGEGRASQRTVEGLGSDVIVDASQVHGLSPTPCRF